MQVHALKVVGTVGVNTTRGLRLLQLVPNEITILDEISLIGEKFQVIPKSIINDFSSQAYQFLMLSGHVIGSEGYLLWCR